MEAKEAAAAWQLVAAAATAPPPPQVRLLCTKVRYLPQQLYAHCYSRSCLMRQASVLGAATATDMYTCVCMPAAVILELALFLHTTLC